MLNKAALGFRLSQFVFCLASFAVMAVDKTQRWSGERKHPRISVSPSLSRPKSLLSLSALSLRFSENKKPQGVGSVGEELGIKWCAPSWSQVRILLGATSLLGPHPLAKPVIYPICVGKLPWVRCTDPGISR
jgi:hypothetical protein